MPPKKNPKDEYYSGWDTFSKEAKKKKKKDKDKKGRFRPLRDVFAKIPGWLCTVEAILIHIIHGLVGLVLLIISITEFRRVRVLPYFIDAFYPLCAIVYDLLSLFLMSSHSSAAGWHVLMSLAGYQSLLATMLFIGEKRRGRKTRAPPLFPFVTYAAMPWSTMSLWFVTLDPKGEPWPWPLEALVLFPLLGARWMLRKKDSWRHRVLECCYCILAFAFLRFLFFGNYFWRAIMNWKYVISFCNLIWPIWAMPMLAKYFQKKERTKKRDEERPRIPAAQVPSKSMKPTASMNSNINNPQ